MSRNRSDDNYFLPLFSGADGAARARFRTSIPAGTYTPYVRPPAHALTADTNFYVNSSTGSDSNDGRSSPWRTVQHACRVLNDYDFASYHAFVNLTGTFPENVQVYNTHNGQMVFIGPATIEGRIRAASAGSSLYIQTLTVKSASDGTMIYVGNGTYLGFASLTLDNTLDYDVIGVQAVGTGTVADGSSQFTASGPHYLKLFASDQHASLTGAFSGFNLPDLPAWQTAGWEAKGSSTMSMSGINKVTAPATGKRYAVAGGATLHVNSFSPADVTYLPGDVSGTVTGGGSAYT